MLAIIGNKFFPGFGDRYLAKTGYSSQQYDGLDDPNRPFNLFETVNGKFGAHGDFDKKAKSYSIQLLLDQNIKIILLILIILIVCYFLFF